MAHFEPPTKYLPASMRDRLESRPNLWRILTNIGWLFGDTIMRMGVGLLVGVWIARYLGPAQFGLLNYAIALVGLFTPLALLGLDNVVVRDLVHDPQRSGETLGTALVLKLVSGSLTWSLALGVVLLRGETWPTPVLVGLAGATLLLQAFDTFSLWFQSQVRSKYAVLARNTSFILVTAIRIGLVLTVAPLVAFAGALALEASLTAVALVIAYRLTGHRLIDWSATRTRALALLHRSWPLMLSGIAVAISLRIDQVLLRDIRGDAELGIYAAAVRVSELWYFVPAAIAASVSPTIITAKKIDAALYRRRMQQLLNLMAVVGYAVALPITILSGPLISLLYGSEYAGAGPILGVHIWALVFVTLGGAQTVWLINEERTWFALVSTAMGALMNVLLNLTLIPSHGAFGAAIATVLSYGTTVLVVCFLHRPTRPLGMMTLKALILRE